jgi:preprotein translocase subunit SecG
MSHGQAIALAVVALVAFILLQKADKARAAALARAGQTNADNAWGSLGIKLLGI